MIARRLLVTATIALDAWHRQAGGSGPAASRTLAAGPKLRIRIVGRNGERPWEHTWDPAAGPTEVAIGDGASLRVEQVEDGEEGNGEGGRAADPA